MGIIFIRFNLVEVIRTIKLFSTQSQSVFSRITVTVLPVLFKILPGMSTPPTVFQIHRIRFWATRILISFCTDPDPICIQIWNTARKYIEGKKKDGTNQESQRIEMAGVMARWREEVRNIQLEHQQEHRDLEEVQY